MLYQETYPEGHQVDTGETREVEDPEGSGEMRTEPIMKDVGGQIKEDAPKPNPCGFILLGFPCTELHAQKLKENFLEFDRVLQLTDTRDENAGAEVKARMAEKDMHYSWEAEQEKVAKTVEGIKAGFGEEIAEKVAEINCSKENAGMSTEEVTRTIRAAVDPFYLRVDSAEENRANADLGEEERRLPKSDFGSYCPVTYVNDNFLQKGNPEFEVTIFGKTFTFAGEKEMEDFRGNPTHFLSNLQLPLQPPMPKVMVLGQKGAGITTQVSMLCDKYRLSTLSVKEEFLAKMKSEKEVRRRARLLARGFRPPTMEEGVEQPDEEIVNDPGDFPMDVHERELM